MCSIVLCDCEFNFLIKRIYCRSHCVSYCVSQPPRWPPVRSPSIHIFEQSLKRAEYLLNCTEYSAVVLQFYAIICKCIPYSTNRLLAKISVCKFQGSGMDDIAVSSLLPLITHSRGSRLPCCEDAQAALWSGLRRTEASCQQFQLASHVSEPS